MPPMALRDLQILSERLRALAEDAARQLATAKQRLHDAEAKLALRRTQAGNAVASAAKLIARRTPTLPVQAV